MKFDKTWWTSFDRPSCQGTLATSFLIFTSHPLSHRLLALITSGLDVVKKWQRWVLCPLRENSIVHVSPSSPPTPRSQWSRQYTEIPRVTMTWNDQLRWHNPVNTINDILLCVVSHSTQNSQYYIDERGDPQTTPSPVTRTNNKNKNSTFH